MVKVFSPAKINLGLWITGKRSDLYHEILTVYHKINLFDEIEIEPFSDNVVEVVKANIPSEENLVTKGLNLIYSLKPLKNFYRIRITKNIPIGGGLGGGSSNLATVLKAINALENNIFTEKELEDICASLSTDSVFFLKEEKAAVGYSKGDKLKPLEPLNLDITLIFPKIISKTKEVYQNLKEQDFSKISIEELMSIYKNNLLLENIKNDLTTSATQLYPEIGEIIRFLESFNIRAHLSGSGSTVFVIGLLPKEIIKALEGRSWLVYSAKTIF